MKMLIRKDRLLRINLINLIKPERNLEIILKKLQKELRKKKTKISNIKKFLSMKIKV